MASLASCDSPESGLGHVPRWHSMNAPASDGRNSISPAVNPRRCPRKTSLLVPRDRSRAAPVPCPVLSCSQPDGSRDESRVWAAVAAWRAGGFIQRVGLRLHSDSQAASEMRRSGSSDPPQTDDVVRDGHLPRVHTSSRFISCLSMPANVHPSRARSGRGKGRLRC